MPEKREGARKYNRIKIRLKLAGLLFTLIYLVVFQIFLSSPSKTLALRLSENFYLAFAAYLIIFSLLHYVLNFSLALYSGFFLERRFKLSNQSFFAWFKDDVKSGVLSLPVFLIFIEVLYFFLRTFPHTWWMWIAAFWFLATIFIAKITPVIIIPLFYKVNTVPEKLKKRIVSLSERCGIKVLNVYKIDFSRKTNKLNAAVTGLGRTRRVILADNLIQEFTEEEIDGVLAHEFGHHRFRHMWKLMAFGALSTFFSFYVLYLASTRASLFLGGGSVHDMAIFPSFMLILFIMGFLMLPLQNGFSRKLETEADLFALRTTKDKRAFTSLMKKLAEKNLADTNPPAVIKFLFYSHPPISERIKLAEDFKS